MTSKNYFRNLFLFIAAIALFGCKNYQTISEQSSLLKIQPSLPADSSIYLFYKPFKDSLDKIMKISIAELENDLTKNLPECTLGNMMVDILKSKTEDYTQDKIDVAILNYGSIRTPSLSKGTLTIENAYLLMPFDNYIVEQTITGKQLKALCDSIAQKMGWPVAGLSFQIKNNIATNILVNNSPIVETKNYTLAICDYLANGGDGLTFLKTIPQKQTGKLYRDAIIESWKATTLHHEKVTSKLENRISYAK